MKPVENTISIERDGFPGASYGATTHACLLTTYSPSDLTLHFDPANLLAIDALQGQLRWTLQFKCGYLVGITIRIRHDRKGPDTPGTIFCNTLKAKAIGIDEPHLIVSRREKDDLYITDPVYAMRLDLYMRQFRIAREGERKSSLRDQITKRLGTSGAGSTKATEQSPLDSDARKLISLIDLEFENRGSTIVNDAVMRSLSYLDRFALLMADPSVNNRYSNGKWRGGTASSVASLVNSKARYAFGDKLAYLYMLFTLIGKEAIVVEYINCIHSILMRHYSVVAPRSRLVIPASKEELTSFFASNMKSVKQRGFFYETSEVLFKAPASRAFSLYKGNDQVLDRVANGNIGKNARIREQTKDPARSSRPSSQNSGVAPEERLGELRRELTALNATMDLQRQQYKNAQAVINRLTNDRRIPVREGSAAYHQCVKASKIIAGIERGAPALKAKKAELEARIEELNK